MALNAFLRARKALVLSALGNGTKSAGGSTASTAAAAVSAASPSVALVMGNEAGDADSLACAVGFAFLASRAGSDGGGLQESGAVSRNLALPWTPLIQTKRGDLHLRRENELALQVSGIDANDLLWLDELDSARLHPAEQNEDEDAEAEGTGGRISAALALVDHNKLSTHFGAFGEDGVSAIIDHHADEEFYRSAEPRLIRPPTQAGSCASVLAEYMRSRIASDAMPAELATLLLSAILIDTHNLDAKVAKARPVDESAVHWLWPLSSIAQGSSATASASASAQVLSSRFADLQSYHDALAEAKEDISTLGTRDLIRRDYKSYSLLSSDGGRWSVGLTSVPLGLQAWVDREADTPSTDTSTHPFLAACDAYCAENELDLLGLLCTFTDPSTQRFRRVDFLYAPAHSAARSKELASTLQNPPPDSNDDAAPELGLQDYEVQRLPTPSGAADAPWWAAYDQTALKATRKQFAPAIKAAALRSPAPSQRDKA